MSARKELLCALVLIAVHVSLRSFGLRRTLAVANRVPALRHASGGDPLLNSTSTATAVAGVAALFPGRARCLEQSLTLMIVLRLDAIPARFKMGAQALPFFAHAWVEVLGQPINSERELLANLVPFPDLSE